MWRQRQGRRIVVTLVFGPRADAFQRVTVYTVSNVEVLCNHLNFVMSDSEDQLF